MRLVFAIRKWFKPLSLLGRRESKNSQKRTVMKIKLNGKRVALLVTDGFEQVELTEPKEALEKAGAKADIVSPAGSSVRAWDLEDWGQTFRVDVPLKKARPEDFDALVLPGGVMNPDKLRLDRRAWIL